MRRAVVLLTLPVLLACDRQVPPIETSVLWKRDFAYVAPVDFNGDSTDELLVIENDFCVNCLDQDLRAVGSTRWLHKGTLSPDRSLAGGIDSAHLWLTYKRRDSLYLQTLSGRAALVAVGKDSLPPDGWDGYAGAVVVADIDKDGRLEAVVTVVSAMDARPRGIFVLDWQTGRLKWKHETGPAVRYVVLRDVDADGCTELLFGSSALRNGNIANGTTDESSYVFLLGSDGQARWRTPIGRHSSEVFAAWLDDGPPSTPRVLAWEMGNVVEGRNCDSLFILDGSSGAVRKRTGFGTFTNWVTVAADAKGTPRVVVAGSDKALRLLNTDLGLVREVRLTSALRQIVAADFTRAPAYELAAVTSDGRLRVMDPALNYLKEETLSTAGGAIELSEVRLGKRTRLLVHEINDDRSTWSLLDVVPVPLAGRRVPLVPVVIVVTALALAFAGTLLGLRYRQTHDMSAVVRGLTGQAGIVEIDHRGRVRHSTPKARELLGGEVLPAGPLAQTVKAALAEPVKSQPEELPVVLDSGKTVLARAARVRSGVMLTLEDISAVEYLKRVSTWVPVAQKLAHDIKNPLTAISLTLQRVEKAAGPDSQRHVDSMRDDIDRLKKMADGFMRLSKLEPPKLTPADINEVVRQCAGKFEDAKPAGIEFRCELAESLPPVALDRDQMAIACSNIIENAVSAIVSSGAVAIRTSYNVEEKKVVVSIRDTGKGIPERYLDKVFEPYFTLKPGGTGLGMALTKRIIEDHKGTIAIESTEGKGTTVTIELPAA